MRSNRLQESLAYSNLPRIMKLLFILDPLPTLTFDTDSTCAIMEAALEQGHQLWTCTIDNLSLEHNHPYTQASITTQHETSFVTQPDEPLPLSSFDAVLFRTDPPVNIAYLQATWILEQARGSTLLINDPQGIRECNEHLSVLRFPTLTPPTIVTQKTSRLRQFLNEQGGALILKPVDGYGGKGIFIAKNNDPNLSMILETATANEQQWTIAQQYLPQVQTGDKRILLLDGEFLGAVLRVPDKQETRSNLCAGGTAIQTTLSQREQTIIDTIAPTLRCFGLILVGIDVIGDYLTEINCTSPTGIRHIDSLQGSQIASQILDWISRHRIK